jgi:flagellar biogenesis protein FliO
MQTDYGMSLLSALLALLITAGLSYLLVRFSPSSRWFGRFAGRARLLEIEDMLRIDPKSTLLIVRVEGRRLLLASHSGAAPTLITELAPQGTHAQGEAT